MTLTPVESLARASRCQQRPRHESALSVHVLRRQLAHDGSGVTAGSRMIDGADSRCEAGEIMKALLRFHEAIIGRRSARRKGPLSQLSFIWLNNAAIGPRVLRRCGRPEAPPRWSAKGRSSHRQVNVTVHLVVIQRRKHLPRRPVLLVVVEQTRMAGAAQEKSCGTG